MTASKDADREVWVRRSVWLTALVILVEQMALFKEIQHEWRWQFC